MTILARRRRGGHRPRQQRYLLALLLARTGRPVSTSDLIELIWGEDAPASAPNVIHKYVGALRPATQRRRWRATAPRPRRWV
ncbi:helix-turn-helix domain-containing protein [Micromonosporaceae bacterium B7E4]